MTEEWRSVVGYEGIYDVSSHGRVRRVVPHGPNKTTGGIMAHVVGKRGYPVVQLWGANKERKIRTVHQLMAESFFGPRPEGFEIDHKDGVKTNNLLPNLEYVSKRENLRRRDALGLGHRGERTGNSVLKDSDISEIFRLRSEGLSYSQIAAKIGSCPATIFNVVKGKTWTHVSGSLDVSL